MRKINDFELNAAQEADLTYTNLDQWREDNSVIDYGALMLCIRGTARVFINFHTYDLYPDRVLIVFPNDVVCLQQASPDFQVRKLQYSASLLREASLQMEQTIYSSMRDDRCSRHEPALIQVTRDTLSLASVYFEQEGCRCLHAIVLLLLKAFFVGYHDYLLRHPDSRPPQQGSYRRQELFNQFMQAVETYYQESHDVGFYADKLHITPKYLSTIVQEMTQHTPKVIINHYVILQLKLRLRSTDQSIKQLADAFHFSDLSFFCRYFKQHTGYTPYQFKKGTRE